MHDYQLDRLNTRSFEQLIQALGLEIIGPHLMIFGDGPDGGREATFDGPSKYPTPDQGWNGYGLVQAKFRQVPDPEPKKNADWAIKQLKSEFAKLKPRPKGKQSRVPGERTCPEYYIFATNLTLTPVAKRGGKDRVRALLDGYKKSHGLKDYAIWDKDQICRFLDGQPGIRTTYTAWLLPGDILAAMRESLHLEGPEFFSTIRRYLESELLDDQYARLGQGGYTDAKNIALGAVFVDLPVELPKEARVSREDACLRARPEPGVEEDAEDEEPEQVDPPTFLRVFFEEGRQVLKPSVLHRQAPRGGPGKAQPGRAVLVGGPGQGKTTVGQFACQLLRAAILRGTAGPFSPDVTQALDRIGHMSDGLPPVCARRYPLRVDLKHLASSLATAEGERANGLFDYLLKRIAKRTNSVVRPEDFRRWLGTYPWVLVLDGLDEVPASSNRQQVLQAIRDFVGVEAHDADADLLVLATTRPQGYSEEFDPSLYRHLSLAPLNAEQALAYGLRLATARHPGQPTRIEELAASLRKATTNPATARLMQSPLQVTIMLALIEGGGEPPEQRWKLFHDYYDVIYRREKERATPFSVILGRYEPDIHWIHHRAGWVLQGRNAAAGRTDARLAHEEFEQIVDHRLQSQGHSNPTERAELVRQIRLAATDRLVLLVGNTEKAIGFEIRSLQEFMAAEHLFDGGESCVQKTLHAIAPYPYWRNVLLFAVGRVFFERQELIDSIVAICVEMNDHPTDPAQRTILAGSRLALAILKDGAVRNQPASIRVMARCAARALDVCDGETAKIFSELFSGVAEEVWKEELSKRLTTSGEALPYHNWLICLRLVETGKPWAHDLLLNHFPWTHRRTCRFLQETRFEWGRQLPAAFWNEFLRQAFKLPLHLLLSILDRIRVPETAATGPILQFIGLSHETIYLKCPLIACGRRTGRNLVIRGREAMKLWAGLQYPEPILRHGHPEWRVCQAISAFAHEPTKATLVNLLVSISRIDPDATVSESRWHFPWQVAACLSARKAGLEWDDIISRIAAGNFGTESDWLRWEGQLERGVELSQFRSNNDLLVSDDVQGTILREAGWSLSPEIDKALLFADALCDALLRWPELKSQRLLFDICCYGLARLDLSSHATAEKVVGRFVRMCSEFKVALLSPVLALVVFGSFTSAAKRSLLAKIGVCSLRPGSILQWGRGTFDANKLLAQILGEMGQSHEWWNVLRAISFLAPLDALRGIPETLLEQLRTRGETFSRAASSLKINSLRWEACDAAEVVREALALKEEYPGHLDRLLEFIESGGKSGPHLEAFLVELIKQAPADFRSGMLERATALLVKLVERRPALSTLPDPAERFQAPRL